VLGEGSVYTYTYTSTLARHVVVVVVVVVVSMLTDNIPYVVADVSWTTHPAFARS
jgi:hypothetical protein